MNGQGSRPLYYASGGKSGSIIDGFTAVDNDQAAVREATTVVLGLGTNKQGGGDNEYKQKVSDMIDKVKGLAPSAKIFWTNLAGTGSKNTYAPYNLILSDLAGPKGFTIVDWANVAAANLPANEVHPTSAGYDVLAKLIVSSVGSAAVIAAPATPGTAPEVMLQALRALPIREKIGEMLVVGITDKGLAKTLVSK